MTLSEKIELAKTALEDKKAEDVVSYDVRGKSSITDATLVATASSSPHLRALSVAVERALAEAGEHARVSGDSESGWIVLDFFDFMVHLFLEDPRKYYDIEALWNQG